MSDDTRLQEPRWWIPWRRTSRLLFSNAGEIANFVQPSLDVGGGPSGSYLSGRPGWRGIIFTTGQVPAVAARRAAMMITASGGPALIRLVYSLDSTGFAAANSRMFLGATATVSALFANKVTVTPQVIQSGIPEDTPTYPTVGTARTGTTGLAVVTGDIDNAAVANSMPLIGLNIGVNSIFWINLHRGESFVAFGSADNSAREYFAEVLEFMDWAGT